MKIAYSIFFLFLIGFGFLGAFLVFYAFTSSITGQPWPPLEKYAQPLSQEISILATIVTSLSVYFYRPAQHAPAIVSKLVAAPITIGCAAVALTYGITHTLPIPLVNGFAILGLVGGLFRICPPPSYAKL